MLCIQAGKHLHSHGATSVPTGHSERKSFIRWINMHSVYIRMCGVEGHVPIIHPLLLFSVLFDQVNGQSMSSASHHEAVGALKAATESCLLVVSREVLVVMPSSTATPSPTPAVASDATKPEKIVERSTSQELREFGMKIAAVHQEKPTVCVEETGPIPTRQQGEESALPGATVVPVKQQEEEESVNEEEVGQKMQSLALEISSREREGFVAMDADKEDVPVERKEAESKGRPSKQSGDYANLDIAKLIQPAEDGEGDGSEKGEGSPDRDLGGPDQLSSVPAELSDSDSSSDSDSDSDVVVLRPDMQKEQSPYPEEVGERVGRCEVVQKCGVMNT